MYKEEKQKLKEYKKITKGLKSLNLIINKIVFNYDLIVYMLCFLVIQYQIHNIYVT